MSTVHLAGLTDDVEVHRDEWGIPHVRARSAVDAFFAQGYVHAQDRLFQMDTARRKMEGRWAEWVGPAGVPADTLARRLGVTAACRRDLDVANDETQAMLTAYAAGVNARLAGLDRLPMEYGLLGVEPEAWEPWHSIAAMRQRGYLMGSVWFKLWRAAAVRAIGPDQVGLLRYDDGGSDRLVHPARRRRRALGRHAGGPGPGAGGHVRAGGRRRHRRRQQQLGGVRDADRLGPAAAGR